MSSSSSDPALVSFYVNDRGRALPPNQKPTRSEQMYGRFREFLVDRDSYTGNLDDTVACATTGIAFHVKARFDWRRADAGQWVINRTSQPDAYCRQEVHRLLADIGAQYAWYDSAAATRQAVADLGQYELTVDHGLAITIHPASVSFTQDPQIKVPTSPHTTSYSTALPTDGGGLEFRAELELEWRVSDPTPWPDWSAEHAEAICRRTLVAQLALVTARFRYDDTEGARRALLQRFGDRPADLPHGLSAQLRRVRLSMDERVLDLPWTDQNEREIFELPSNRRSVPFLATVEYAWSLPDVRPWIGREPSDLAGICRQELESLLRDISRTFSWDAVQQVEDTIEQRLRGQPQTPAAGLRLTLQTVRVAMHPDAAHVDLSEQSWSFDCELPTARGAVSFRAEVEMSWRRSDAPTWIGRPLDEPREIARQILTEQLAAASASWPYDQPGEAERALRAELTDQWLPSDRGVRLVLRALRMRADPRLATVGTGLNLEEFPRRLATAADGIFFAARIDISWRITDPAAWLGASADPGQLCRAEVVRRLEAATRTCAFDDASAAELLLRSTVLNRPFDLEPGLSVTARMVRLEIDPELQLDSHLEQFDYDNIDVIEDLPLAVHVDLTWSIADQPSWRREPLHQVTTAAPALCKAGVDQRLRELVAAMSLKPGEQDQIEGNLRNALMARPIILGHGIEADIKAVRVRQPTHAEFPGRATLGTVDTEIPSATPGMSFRAHIEYTWRVNDRSARLERGVADPKALCESMLTREIGRFVIGYGLDQMTEVNLMLARIDWEPLLRDGLEIILLRAIVREPPELTQALIRQAEAAVIARLEEAQQIRPASATFGEAVASEAPLGPAQQRYRLRADRARAELTDRPPDGGAE